MTHITSPTNPRLKSLRKLRSRRGRELSGTFLAEGEDLILAAEQAGRPPLAGYRLAGSGLGGERFHDVEPAALQAVSTLGSGARVIGVYDQRWGAPAGPLCVYLHGVADPGNVGTVLRSAQAFGAGCVALGPGCADPHSPKAVRASMGAIFAVALARVLDIGELPGERIALLGDATDTLRAAVGDLSARGELPAPRGRTPRGGQPAPGDRRSAGLTLLVGAERDGLPAAVVSACERAARIPIASHSLNAAMAATVALYEVTREPFQRAASSRVRPS